MEAENTRRLILGGVVLAFVLLIAAVWASDASTATSLALTGAIVLVGVGTLTFALPTPMPWGGAEDQRERMKQTVP
jgi:hypothetical protein